MIKHIKKKILSGGTNQNILFACTTLNKDSTFSENFNEINDTVKHYLPYNSKINAYFVCKNSMINENNKIWSDNFRNILTRHNYNKVEPYNTTNKSNGYSNNIINFLSKKNIKFNMIVFSQCNDTLQSILKDSFISSHIKINTFDIIIQNLFSLYNSLEDNGYIINFGYIGEGNEIILENLCSSPSQITLIGTLPYFVFIGLLIPILFTKISTGIYQKNVGINIDYFKEVSNNIKINFCKNIKNNINNNIDTNPKKIYKKLLSIISINKNINYKNQLNLINNQTNIKLQKEIKKWYPFIIHYT
jgi:hypothetical protein